MHKIRLCVVFIFLLSQLKAQTVLEYSSPFKIKSRDFLDQISFADSNSVSIVRHRYNAIGEKFTYLEKFYGSDHLTATLVHKNTHQGSVSTQKMYYEGMVLLGNRKVLITSSYDYEKNKNTAYARFLDEDGYPDGDFVEIGVLDAERKSNRGKFHFQVSPARQYLMIFAQDPVSRNDNEKFKVFVVDTALEMYSKNAYELSYKDREFFLNGLFINDEANACIVAKIYQNRSTMMDQGFQKAEYYYSLLFLRPEDEAGKLTEKNLKLEEKYMINMAFRVDAEQNILVCGTYADDNDYEPSGLFHLRILNHSWETDKILLYQFPDEFIPEFDTDLPYRFGEYGYPTLEISHFMQDPYGGSVLVAEHSLVSEYCYTDFRTSLTTCNYSYYYNDIFVFRMTDSGTVDWKVKISKRQVSRNDYGMYNSFALGVSPSGLHFFYNDSPKNAEKTDPRNYAFMNDVRIADILHVSLNWDGTAAKEIIGNNSNSKTWLRPRFSYQAGLRLYMVASKRNQNALVSVRLMQ